MARLTISLSDEIHLALKETALRQNRSIGKLIEESLLFRGLKNIKTSQQLVSGARKRSVLSEDDAMSLALSEVRESRSS